MVKASDLIDADRAQIREALPEIEDEELDALMDEIDNYKGSPSKSAAAADASPEEVENLVAKIAQASHQVVQVESQGSMNVHSPSIDLSVFRSLPDIEEVDSANMGESSGVDKAADEPKVAEESDSDESDDGDDDNDGMDKGGEKIPSVVKVSETVVEAAIMEPTEEIAEVEKPADVAALVDVVIPALGLDLNQVAEAPEEEDLMVVDHAEDVAQEELQLVLMEPMEEDLSLTLSQPTIDLTLIPSGPSSPQLSPPSSSHTHNLTPLRSQTLARDLSLALVQERPKKKLTRENLTWILSVMPACAQRFLFDDELGLMEVISDPSSPETLLFPDLNHILSITFPPLPHNLAFLPTLPFPLYHPHIPFPTIYLPELLLRGPYLFTLQANLLALRYLHSQTFHFFLLLNLYLTQQSPFRLLFHPFYPSDILMEDASSDSDLVMISPIRSLTPPEDSIPTDPFPFGPPVPEHFPQTSGPSYPNIESAILDMHETTLATTREILARQEELSEQIRRTELRVKLELEVFRLAQEEHSQRITTGMDFMLSACKHFINNAINKVLKRQLGVAPDPKAVQQLQKVEKLRADAAVAEEVALNAMKEERLLAASIQGIIRQNDHIREYLDELPARLRTALPKRPSRIEEEGLLMLKNRQELIYKRKIKKLRKKKNLKKPIAEISSSSSSSEDSAKEDLSDMEDYLDQEYELNFKKALRESRKAFRGDLKKYLEGPGSTSKTKKDDSEDSDADIDLPPLNPLDKGKGKM